MPYIIQTLVQLPPETDAAFEIRVQTFVSDQYYYFTAASGSLPAPPASSSSFIGYPPIEPTNDDIVWDPVALQLVRAVTFSYQNDYYYKFLGISPPLPAPTPFPTAGNVAIWGSGGQILDSGLGFDIPTMNFTNLLPATVNGQAVEYSQLTAGYVPSTRTLTINGTAQDLSADRTWNVGTVTSVGLTLPSGEFTVAGSPVTGSGTLSATWADQVAGTIFAGPAGAGPPATPSFRSLVAGDIPALPYASSTDPRLTDARARRLDAYLNTNVSHTGSTAETVVESLLIPAGLMGTNGVLMFKCMNYAVGTAGSKTFRAYVGPTSGTTVGATQIGQSLFSATQISGGFQREMANKNAANLNESYPATTNNPNDQTNQTTAVTTINYDTSAAFYVILTVTNGSAADTSGFRNAQVYINLP